MSDIQKSIATIRAFTALSLSGEVVDNIASRLTPFREQFAELNIRWVPIPNYHVTLCFIGNIPTDDADKMVPIMAEASAGFAPFEVTLGRICLFPDPDNGGVMIADVVLDTALQRLQESMNDVLLAAGYDIYQRPVYRPHLTLARLKKNRISADQLEKDSEVLINPVSAVHLYKSWKLDGAVKNEIVRTHPFNNED